MELTKTTTAFTDPMGDVIDDPKGLIIVKKLENFKTLLNKKIMVFNTTQMQKDGALDILNCKTDAKGREIFYIGKAKFQWKHVLWWFPDIYKHTDGQRYTLVKVDMNRK